MNKVDLQNRVLQHLQGLAAGEPASAADAKLVGDIIDGVHGMLVADSLAPWELSDVPEYVQIPMTHRVAYDAAPSFGIAQNLDERSTAMKDIRRLASEGVGCADTTEFLTY